MSHIYIWFSALFQLQSFFGHMLQFLDLKTKFIKFGTKFQVKGANFLPSSCTNLLLCNKPVQRNSLRFSKIKKKTVRALRINETKVTSRNTAIVNLFVLGNEKESKMTKGPSFRTACEGLDVSVNPQAPNGTYMWFSRLFQFYQLLASYYRFQNSRLSSINLELNFR